MGASIGPTARPAAPPRSLGWRGGRPRPTWVRSGLLCATVGLTLLLTIVSGSRASAPTDTMVLAASSTGASISPPPTLLLNTVVQPQAICAEMAVTCSAGVGTARLQLTADATGGPSASWPNVQVAFVVETTSYDGVLGTDRSDSLDVCADSGSMAPACEESNAVPFFVANAQTIANAIQAANPHSTVSFALVDYYDAAGEPWDDTDGPEYNVDIGQFVPATSFGGLVVGTFQQSVMNGLWYSWDQDLDNNFLDSSSITALYGAIIGSQLNWQDNAHHVIVWMGSSAPRDPSYTQNYCVSPSEWNLWANNLPCMSQSCEPSYRFAGGSSPNCEGWVQSQDGNAKDSIAALAHNAPACTRSVGGVCTVDTIDLYTTTTDAWSAGWPAGNDYVKKGGGPGGPNVQANAARVILAGCDLAAATGGTWTGPVFATCPNGQTGTLQLVPFGNSIATPNLKNPYLLQAFRSIGFGPVYGTAVAAGTNQPIFQYVAIGNIAVAPDPSWSVACTTPLGFPVHCQTIPTVLHRSGVTVYGWNWSTIPAENVLYLGDTWTASFSIMATGPPYASVPVDACTTVSCRAAGSGAVGGQFTLADYLASGNTTEIRTSFPLATVEVQPPVAPAPPSVAPPAVLPPAPGLPIPVAPAIPAPVPVPIISQVGIGTVSLQAAAAGFLGAGFMRVGLKNRPIALRVAAKSGVVRSRFEGSTPTAPGVGRFE